MASFSLAPYTVRALEKISGFIEPVDNIGPNGADLHSIFCAYLTYRQNNAIIQDETNKRLITGMCNTAGRSASGIIETGEYGYETKIVDITNNQVAHRRTTIQAEMLPFHFSSYIPQGIDEGIIILQRFNTFGIRTIFYNDFKAFFERLVPDYTIKMHPLVPDQFIRAILNEGRITKLRFIRYAIPTDLADAVGYGHEEREGHMEISFHAKLGDHIPWTERIQQLFTDGHRPVEMVELREFDYNTIKVEFEVNGRRRTINLSDFRKIRAYHDITDRIQIGPDGHPIFESIHGVSRQLIIDLAESMGLPRHGQQD